jgi:hypothetical protein
MQNICINKLEKSGPVILGQFPPKYFKDQDLIEIPMKVIPLNAKNGDFTTIIFRDDLIIVSYIFTMNNPNQERPSLFAISATIDETEINPFSFKQIFESIIEQFKNFGFLTENSIVDFLPKLYNAFNNEKTEIRITKSTSIKIEIKDGEINKKKKKKSRKNRSNGMW